jgi:peptidoglycan/LPS O-acetylase OafA/YrhL
MSIKYRPDIDGLRALVVISVILFHFGLDSFRGYSWSKGGFVGVDIFFVISGFLISRIIYDQIDTSRYDVVGFYVRRARRIFPALFAVYAFCAVIVALAGVGQEAKDVGVSLTASLFFVSNVLFASQAGYFGGALNNNPLLHTWTVRKTVALGGLT